MNDVGIKTKTQFDPASEKGAVHSLAIFGSKPTFAEKLHVGRPNIGNRARLLERFNNILDTKWLSNMGPYEREFEQRIADLVGTKHCIAMCNATVALEIAIRALGFAGEVLIPSFTFVATAHALQWQQITPVFCDIDPETHCLDSRSVERMITPRTTGIIGVHLWGHASHIEELAKIATRNNLGLLFDAAHAFGCSHRGQMIGNFGDAEVFSFHATKFFNTFEGGAVVTNNDELAAKIRLMKNFGFADYDEVIYIGTNGKMSEVSAAMGLSSLDSLEEFVDTNRRNYNLYRKELSGIPGVHLVAYDETEKCNYQYVVAEIDEQVTGISRDELVKVLWAENVVARRYFFPGCHRMEPYRSYYPHAGLMLPATEKLVAKVLILPTGTSISEPEVEQVCRIIKLALRNAVEVRRQLSDHSASETTVS
jgi:dTDP-4-amino-4,6-dideoxygalactose transaminase